MGDHSSVVNIPLEERGCGGALTDPCTALTSPGQAPSKWHNQDLTQVHRMLESANFPTTLYHATSIVPRAGLWPHFVLQMG